MNKRITSQTLIERGFIPALGWSLPSDLHDHENPHRVIAVQTPFIYRLDEDTGVFGVTDERGILWVIDLRNPRNTKVITDDLRGFTTSPTLPLPTPENIAHVLGESVAVRLAA